MFDRQENGITLYGTTLCAIVRKTNKRLIGVYMYKCIIRVEEIHHDFKFYIVTPLAQL